MEEQQSSSMTPEELRNNVESILFASGKKVDVYFIKDIIGVDNVRKIKNALEALKKWYDENSKVLMINQEGDLWKMNVRENYSDIVRKLISETDLPKTVLETLSVIAWKSPVYQSEIIHIRGAGAYEHIALLTETEFITKDKHGRSYILKVTNKFFEYFDIEGTEGIKDVFKKIKEKSEQTKVEEFNKEILAAEAQENEAEKIDESDADPEGLDKKTEEIAKVGEFDVIDIEDKKPENIEEETETIGRLEIYEEPDDSIEEKKDIFDNDDFEEKEEALQEKMVPKEEHEEPVVEEEDDASRRTRQIVEDLLDEDEKKGSD